MSLVLWEPLVGAFVAQVQAGVPEGTTVHRFQLLPLDQDQLPAVCVYPAADRAGGDPWMNGTQERVLTVRAEVRVIGRPVDVATAPLVQAVIAAVLADPTLGDLTSQVRLDGIQWDGEELDRPYAAAAIDFDIPYILRP